MITNEKGKVDIEQLLIRPDFKIRNPRKIYKLLFFNSTHVLTKRNIFEQKNKRYDKSGSLLLIFRETPSIDTYFIQYEPYSESF